MEFPKQIYVGLSDSGDGEYYFDASEDIDTIDPDEFPDVAMYTLVKIGSVQIARKFVTAKK